MATHTTGAPARVVYSEPSTRPARVDIMGCPFDVVTEHDALGQIFAWCDEPVRTSHTIITVNVAILMLMRDDPKLAHAIENADLVVVDGKPLVWTSRWLHRPVPERVSGVDLMKRLLERGGDRDLGIFLLGTTQERLDGLTSVIRARYPKVRICGSRNGYFKPADYPEVVAQIRNAKADVLLVGMPAPFKELWCEEHREQLCTPAILGVGGAFDVLGGYVARAPVAVQEAGFEWAWRLAMEPGKLWKRYLISNSRFLALLGRELAEHRILRRVR